MYMHGFLLLLASVASAVASAIPHEHVVHEKREHPSFEWTKRDKIPSDAVLPVRIGLAQRNLDRGPASLLAISDPTSPQYGMHWTAEEVRDAFAPSEGTVKAIKDWLCASGIAGERIRSTVNRGYLTFDATAAELGALLQTDYFLFEHSSGEHRTVATDQYHIPSHLAGHVDFITPGVALMTPPQDTYPRREVAKRQAAPPPPDPSKQSLDTCWEAAIPECFTKLYNVDNDTVEHPGADNEWAIAQLGVSYIQQDMDLFFKKVTKIPIGTKPIDKFINGAQITPNYTALNSEPNLDFQLAWPLVYPHNVTMIESTPSVAEVEEFAKTGNISVLAEQTLNHILDALDASYCTNKTDKECGTTNAPKVLSLSYGANELDVTPAAHTRMCNEFMKLGLQGTTVLVCSGGDGGVAAGPGTDFQCHGPNNHTFNPPLFSTCPWVTAIGATMLPVNGKVPGPEVAPTIDKSGFLSSGGFSNYHTVPDYQKATVDKYFHDNPSPYPTYEYNGSASSIGANGGRFSRCGRGFPDISVLGSNYIVVNNNTLNAGGGGTSSGPPLFGALIWKINSARLSAGKKSLGFINPAIYKHPQMFKDVTEGSNPGCGTKGFAAVKGWDPVTGLGTPDYPRMKSYLLSLP